MKKILVPTDFSECAMTAEKIGLNLAQKCNAQIQFLHLAETPVNWLHLQEEMQNLYPQVRESTSHAEDRLDRLMEIAQSRNVKASKVVKFGSIYEGITNYVKDSDVDFIIMGSHGSSGFKELFLGSNTQKIVRSCRIPILVVKPGHEDKVISDIAFAFTFDEDIAEPFQKVAEFARDLGSRIHLFYVNTPFNFRDSAFMHNRMADFALQYAGVIASTNIYNYQDLDGGLLKFCKSKGVTLLSMATHGRKGLNRIFSRSITESIINHGDIPVLALNVGHSKEWSSEV